MRSGLTLCPLLVVLLVGHQVAPVAPANLLTSYLPASMQALAYYIDLLQYEPLSSTTVEPPFSADDAVDSTTASARPSTPVPTRMRTTTTRRPGGTGALGSVWWQPPSWWETSSPPPVTTKSTTASARPSTPLPTRMSTTTTTRRPGGTGALGSVWWQAPSWWESSSQPPLSTESTTASAPPSTPVPTRMSTTTTTRRPNGTGAMGSGWQPPSWWLPPQRTSSTERPSSPPTLPHRPGIFAPASLPRRELEGYTLFEEIGDDADFDKLPLSLIRDIQSERHDFTNDVESLDNFLRLYDDNYGRAAFDVESAMDRWSTASIAGKKRVPPTKPYVDFLLVYDLLKRDAKAANLSKYEGYSEDLLEQLHELSQASSARQLHTLFQRMLDRGDVQRSDVVSRVQGIVKDLGNPKSATSKALAFIPSMQFLP
nr:mucin-5B [Drosophila suzukii]